MFDLASERIEYAALLSLHEHCPPDARAALGLTLQRAPGVLGAGASQDGSVLINRTLGLGVEAPATLDDVRQVVDGYRAAGVPNYFLHIYPSRLQPGVYDELPALGLERARGWRKFERGAAPPPAAKTDLRVERVGVDRAHHFGRIVADAFGMSEAAGPMLAGLAHDSRWHLYVSYEGDSPAGAGALMVDGECGWCEWGATSKAFRQRGSQGAIMSARLQAAIDAGCTRIFTETGEAVPGDPQHSYRNIERYGFVAGDLRENWRPRSA